MNKIAERLRVIRKERKESGDTAAKRFNMHQSTWSAWELGKSEPNLDLITDICKEYGVSSDWLLGITDNRMTITNGDGSTVNLGDNAHITQGADQSSQVSFLEAQLKAANDEKSRLLAVIERLTAK